MIEFEIDQASRERLQSFLNSLPSRVMAQVHQALKTLVYQQVQMGIQKYFAGSGPKGGPTTSKLTSRSGALVNSLLDSVMTGIDPPSPGGGTKQITLRIGSSLPYARIHEYGGYAGRKGPFKKKDGKRPYLPARPYLEPIFNDLQAALPDMLQQALNTALSSP
jgi:phage gpG-like protein